MNKKRLLIVFVKNPELGQCKTRLAATMGDKKALILYKNMLKRTKEVVEEVDADKFIFYSSFVDQEDLWSIHPPFYKHLQHSKPDLGVRMQSAFEEGFRVGYSSICVMGSDCYHLDEHIITQAFEELEKKEAVLGPSTDGGYYLLGMNTMQQAFFHNKEWSTESVAVDTVQNFKALGLSYTLLKELTDIDTEEDLKSMPEEVVVQLLS